MQKNANKKNYKTNIYLKETKKIKIFFNKKILSHSKKSVNILSVSRKKVYIFIFCPIHFNFIIGKVEKICNPLFCSEDHLESTMILNILNCIVIKT